MTKRSPTSTDHDEFMRRFLESQRGILRYVLCFVPNLHDARDIVQNTAIALWKKYDQYDPSEPFLPWACRFSLVEVRRYMRNESKWKLFLDDETIELLAVHRDAISEGLDERRSHLQACLKELPARQNTIVKDYYFHDLTVEQISKATGRSVEAIYKSLQRIRSSLMKCIRRRQRTEIGVEQ